MKQNIGRFDKFVRLVLAAGFIFLALWFNQWWWYIFAVLLIITVLIGFCLPYKLLGISTAKKVKK